MKHKFGKVAVLCGGLSAERDVSLQSGQNVFEALKQKGIDAHLIDVQADIMARLIEGEFDRTFVIVHGQGAEDGVLLGALQTLGLPYTGCDVAASAFAMDKVRSKWIFQALQLPTVPFEVVTHESQLATVLQKISLPVCVKPAKDGSSNGVSKVTVESELKNAFDKAVRYSKEVIIEPWIQGKEFTVAMLNGQAFPPVEIRVIKGFYDYEAKYQSDATEYLCPCHLTPAEEKQIQQLALDACRALGCEGWSRVDFIQDEAGKFWLLEVNTIPGMTSHSLMPKAAKAAGIEFDDLVIRILETSVGED
ncbi:MAG: D-alanine--D-alanine ligase [Gammaproteobacteria bacterium GWE2_42_36]|nr:MAG: D-alanine--D-alanine ligase [Gammaproteobacteria bacterium GWE2_42_36]HCU04910.1 D-alanine--D-alanine ligase [Coxiellaceae bacterium]